MVQTSVGEASEMRTGRAYPSSLGRGTHGLAHISSCGIGSPYGSSAASGVIGEQAEARTAVTGGRRIAGVCPRRTGRCSAPRRQRPTAWPRSRDRARRAARCQRLKRDAARGRENGRLRAPCFRAPLDPYWSTLPAYERWRGKPAPAALSSAIAAIAGATSPRISAESAASPSPLGRARQTPSTSLRGPCLDSGLIAREPREPAGTAAARPSE